MGGGSIWRGVTRVVSPAVRVGSASTGTSCSFCKKVGASAPRAQTARLRSCACTPGTTQKVATSSVNQQGSALWDADDWEFAEEEERVDHLVFGSLPSRTEIEEASSELQNALRLGLVAPQGSDQAAVAARAFSPGVMGQSGLSRESSKAAGEEVKHASEPKMMASQLALDWVEPAPIRSWQGVLQAGRRDNVAEAFRQFQHNPEVQSMVVSLATDPAIWDAVSANEKIQEFKRKLTKDKAAGTEGRVQVVAEAEDETLIAEDDHSPNIFSRWQSFWQRKWSMFVDVLTHIIDGLFSAADKKVFAEEDGDVIDRTVKSCTMLALIVLSVVILKRLAVQAA